MPNWCSNDIEISGNKQELDRLAAFLATGEQDFDFEVIAKTPEGDGWYEWRIENWGTKWNPENSTVDRTSDTTMTAWFDTAWSPPIPIIQKLSELFPTLEIMIEFEEEGLEFSGYKTFKSGTVIAEEDVEDTEEENVEEEEEEEQE
jgi:hypothetical protein